MKPVLDELHYHSRSSVDCLHRVWWIGTELASSFPFHATGDSAAGLMESAHYRVVSSYASSIKALAYARERVSGAVASRSDPLKLLIVTMANTPGADDLPGAGAEKSEVMATVGASALVQPLAHPDVTRVMQHLGLCNIAHFACHGISDPFDSSGTGLLLQTAKTAIAEPKPNILSASNVSQTRLSHAEIAYLSAYPRAENPATKLVDEVLHVVLNGQYVTTAT